jgi:hypothetical protein
LSAHPTRARWRTDVGRDGHSLELLVPFRDSLPERDPLCTCSYRVRGVFDIRTTDILAVCREDCGADAEVRVWAVRHGFGNNAAGMQSMELSCCYVVRLGGLDDVSFVARIKEWESHIEDGGVRQEEGNDRKGGRDLRLGYDL